MRRGRGFYTVAMDHPIHRRMATLIGACSGESPAGTRAIVLAVVGDRAESLTRKQAYHLVERLLSSAVRNGFVTRLPFRAPSDASSVSGRLSGRRGTVYKESLYVATDLGRMFAERHERYVSLAGRVPEERPGLRRGGESRNRARTLARAKRELRTGVPSWASGGAM